MPFGCLAVPTSPISLQISRFRKGQILSSPLYIPIQSPPVLKDKGKYSKSRVFQIVSSLAHFFTDRKHLVKLYF